VLKAVVVCIGMAGAYFDSVPVAKAALTTPFCCAACLNREKEVVRTPCRGIDRFFSGH